ncbi:MAG: hypothetical protein N2255_01010 [Kiritimatiellae bacterium]|nr:hypothetical protein [Kiritimatiellia bacterium]
MKRTSLLSVVLVGLTGLPTGLMACSTPVYQYALAWWLPDAYVGTLFHRGPLSADQKALVQRFEQPVASNLPPPNVWIQTVDVDGDMSSEARTLLASLGSAALPVLVLQYPPSFGDEKPVWKGPLTAENIGRIIDSPARRKIAERIIAGDVGVWVLIESGTKEKDDEAFARLEKEIKSFEQEMKAAAATMPNQPETTLPEEADQPSQPEIYMPPSYSFTILRISRSDPAEEVLLAMLLNSDRELEKYANEPIAIPVFAQGRALYPLVGETIDSDNILSACGFMVGPCSCQVKALNPGVDLILAANWQEALKRVSRSEQVEPELRGAFVGSQTPGPDSGPRIPPLPDSPTGSSGLIRAVAVVMAVVVGAAIVGGVFLTRRSGDL